MRRVWQTFHVAIQCLVSACLQLYTVGTKLQTMEVAFKRITTHEILYGVCAAVQNHCNSVSFIVLLQFCMYFFTDHGHPDRFIDVMAFHYIGTQEYN